MRDKVVGSDDRVAIYMRIPVELYRTIEAKARKKNTTITELFCEWIEKFVPKRRENGGQREREIHRKGGDKKDD